MSVSAIFMAVLGLAASFLPQEILLYLGIAPTALATLLVQISGALYLGFAILDWMARGVLIGGIYSRPLALGNFLHFAVVAITLVKLLFELRIPLVIAGAAAYCVLAVWFGLVLFTHPGTRSAQVPTLQ
ncbi:MAG TPA: hypothetical protein VFG91_04100 [Woeseiaceae bacterium]|nr:hypothetical protein [Woeseiaceae bacterium]